MKHAPEPSPAIPLVPLLRVTEQDSFDDGEDRRSAFYRQQAWQHTHTGGVSPMHTAAAPQAILTIPNVLTFLRLILVPVVFALMYDSWALAPLWAASLFVVASVTDWLDGYVARKVGGPAGGSSSTCGPLLVTVPWPCHPMLCTRDLAVVAVKRGRKDTLCWQARGRDCAASPVCSAHISSRMPSVPVWLCAQLNFTTVFGAFLDPVADKIM
jgi:hypothetical protein